MSVKTSSGEELYYNIFTADRMDLKMEHFHVVTIMPVRYGPLVIVRPVWRLFLGKERKFIGWT